MVDPREYFGFSETPVFGQPEARRVTIPHNVTPSDLQSSYALGYTDSEHQRLIRRLSP